MNKPQQYSKCNIADGIKMHIPNRWDKYIFPKGIRAIFACGIRNLGNFWLVESGILGIPIRNTAVGIRHLTDNWNLESSPLKDLESSNRNPESTAWNPESMTVFDSLTWGDIYKLGAGL